MKAITVRGLKWILNLDELIDSCIYYYGYFEAYSTKIVLKMVKRNMVVFDIGANIGYYTLLLSLLVRENGRVYAFEPRSGAMNRLKEHCQINGIKNVKLEKKALSESTKRRQLVSFRYTWPLIEGWRPTDPEVVNDTEIVDFISLDDYVAINNISSIDFIKIDVDGYEYKVIQGGVNSIKKFKPVMIIEFGKGTLKRAGDSLERLIDLLASLGYSFYSEKNLKQYATKESLLNTCPPDATINVLCKPNRKVKK